MDIFWIRALSQSGIYVTFALYLGAALRRGPRAYIPLLGTVVYAVVFEHFNMLRYAHTRGGYSYHAQSWLFLWHDVPLYIPLAWAFIVATSRALTDEIVAPAWAKPFCDALLALLIDLSLDVIAIRLHFWTWRGVAWNQAFLGVPADNFLGWLLVTFTFCTLTRRLWRRPLSGRRDAVGRSAIQLALLPGAAYVSYLALEAVVHGGYALFGADTLERQFGVLSGVLVLFLAVVLAGNRRGALSQPEISASSDKQTAINTLDMAEEDRAAGVGRVLRLHPLALHGPRHIFHIFALIGFFCLPLAARSTPVLAFAFMVWLMEMGIAWRVGCKKM